MRIRYLLALLLLLPLAACAHMEPPRPPLKRIPPPPEGMTAVQRGGALEIAFDVPSSNLDRTPIVEVRGVEVVGHGEGETEPRLLRSWLVPELRTVKPGTKLTLRLPIGERLPWAQGRVSVAVRFRNGSERWSAFTPMASCLVAPVAEPPARLRAQPAKGRVALEWEAVSANCDGSAPALLGKWLVLRRRLPDGAEEEAGRVDGELRGFADTGAAPDQSYAYALAALREVGGGDVRGRESMWVTVDTRDVYPPDAPSRLSVLNEGRTLRLIWDPSTDSDVAGYLVFRAKAGEAAVQLTSEPVPTPTWVDTEADGSVPYDYTVVAVDTHGNRSVPSAPARCEPAR